MNMLSRCPRTGRSADSLHVMIGLGRPLFQEGLWRRGVGAPRCSAGVGVAGKALESL